MHKNFFKSIVYIFLSVVLVGLLVLFSACSREQSKLNEGENIENIQETMDSNLQEMLSQDTIFSSDQTETTETDTTVLTENSEDTIIDTSEISATIQINTAFREQMGKSSYNPAENENKEILLLLESLELYLIEKPDIRDFPTGGSVIVYRYTNNGSYDTFDLYSKDIIEYNGKYYKSNSDSYDKLISLLTDILYNY